MHFAKHAAFALALLMFCPCAPGWAAEAQQAKTPRVDIPVQPKEAKVVIDMDHLVFSGDQPVGFLQMAGILRAYKAAQVPVHIVAVFHGPAGYMILNDAAYNAARKSWYGNPFKGQIKDLQEQGVQFEMCVNTAKHNGWMNEDLLPDVKVNGGATIRIIQLMQDGYVQLHP
jgi:intracellular sulfur oxidation DsrE/DsrF family protein